MNFWTLTFPVFLITPRIGWSEAQAAEPTAHMCSSSSDPHVAGPLDPKSDEWFTRLGCVQRAFSSITPGGSTLSEVQGIAPGSPSLERQRDETLTALVVERSRRAEVVGALSDLKLILLGREKEVAKGKMEAARDPLSDLRLQHAEMENSLQARDDAIRSLTSRVQYLEKEIEKAGGSVAYKDRRHLSLLLDELLVRVDDLERPVSHEAWCDLLVTSGVLRTEIGEANAGTILQDAAAAYGGGCRQQMSPFLGRPLHLAAWSEALFMLGQERPTLIIIDADRASWRIDGQPVLVGFGQEITLRPGNHRIEREMDGIFQHRRFEVGPGERYRVRATTEGLQADRMPPESRWP